MKLIAIIMMLYSQFANGESITISPENTIIIAGEIRDLSEQSNKLLQLAVAKKEGEITNEEIYGNAAAKQVINILLESPGGSVFAGNVFLNAMHVAQGRGYELRCIVPSFAASMAFIIMSYCDERITLPNALLLFHPISRGFMGRITEEVLNTMLLQMKLLSEEVDAHLKKVMGMSDKEYAHLNNREVFFTGLQLKNKTKEGFIKIVDAINGMDDIFSLSKNHGMQNKSIHKYTRDK